MHLRRLVLYSLCSFFGSFLTVPLLGQIKSERPLQLTREWVSSGVEPRPVRVQDDTIRVLALTVDFPADTDTLTTGNGKFQLGSSASGLFDPPPHNTTYFSDKLQFLSNYFRKVSNGKVSVKGEVFGQVITLSKPMASYSPPKDRSDDKRLADLVVECWRTADSLNPSLQFDRYDAFVIFHAGVGRDIDLVSVLGFDPTPNDIPSLTFTLKTFREYLKDASFTGIVVDGGAFKITNTLLLPETETRPLRSGSRIDTLQLSINGLLAASFGTYLGLPDLFDTKTGRSALGTFGLMDGAAIGAFAGLFPPEPSAWEKVYLGWVTPITIQSQSSVISLPAVGLTNVGQDTIYKIPINNREYFLVENRSRDPRENGQSLTIRQGGEILIRQFAGDIDGFRLDDVSGIAGSVIDVEDFDWALPGLTTSDEEFRGGGILIWHIGEDVIERGLVDNTVNANINLRGVDLEEADGSQDIGRVYELLQAGSGTELGWPLDCWFSGNISPVYKNVFDNDSNPNSKSNSGALSLVTIKDFSKVSPRMTATVQIGNGNVTRLDGFGRILSSNNNATPPTATSSMIVVGANKKVYAFKLNGGSKTVSSDGLLAPNGGAFALAVTEVTGNSSIIAGAEDSSLYIWQTFDNNGDGGIDSMQTTVVPLGSGVTTPPAFADLSLARSVVIGGEKGTVWEVALNGTIQKNVRVSTSSVTSLTQLPTANLSKPTELFFACGGTLYGEQLTYSLGDSSLPWILAAGVVPSAGPTQRGQFPREHFIVAAQKGGTRVVAISRSLTDKLFEYALPKGAISDVAVADLDQDGVRDIILTAGKYIYALHANGSVVAGFPIATSGESSFVGTTLIADVNGDSRPDLLALQSSGELTAYDASGELIPGYPLQLASSGDSYPVVFRTEAGKIGALSVSSSGAMHAIELNKSYKSETIIWSQYLGSAEHKNYDGSVTQNPVAVPADFLPVSRVYNWPNPVYGSTTQIRYYTPEDANISIKIFDLAGAKITELQSRAVGGIDGEVTWNVSQIQSGVYLARIEATGNNRSEVAIIKIAVVK